MKKYLVEFIGTFFLIFVIGMVVRGGSAHAPFAIAATLMAVIFAGGHISGAHYNPAVTIAVYLRGRCEAREVWRYWCAQFLAAIVAAFLVGLVFGSAPGEPNARPAFNSFIVEFLFTFALAWVILNVATAKGTAGNSFYGLAIAAVVLAGALTVGGISGGAFNPAVGLGVFLMGLENVQQFALYLVADLAGGIAAALAFRATNGPE